MGRPRTTRRTAESSSLAVRDALAGIRALVATLGRSARSVEQRTGVTNAQLFLLRELSATDDLTINELAARVMTNQSTVSVIVTRLEAAGLVRRTRAVADARRVHVALTAKGAKLATRAPKPPTAQLIAALERLSKTELIALSDAISALLTQLGVAKPASPPLFESLAVEDERPRGAPRPSRKRGGSSHP